MKKEKQIGVRVGLPVFFLLELEDIYKHREDPHRALAFPDFVGLLVGMGLEAYRTNGAGPRPLRGPRPRRASGKNRRKAIRFAFST